MHTLVQVSFNLNTTRRMPVLQVAVGHGEGRRMREAGAAGLRLSNHISICHLGSQAKQVLPMRAEPC